MSTFLETILKKSNEMIEFNTKYEYKRDLFYALVKSDSKVYQGIVGLRGTGKTVLLCQLAKEKKGVYISLDSLEVKGKNITQIIEGLNKEYGLTTFFLDEIHSLKEWDGVLKNLYDSKDYKIFFTGSSAIDIISSSYDLSRRVIVSKMNTLSFREYLKIKYGINSQEIKFEDLVNFEKRSNLLRDYMQYYPYFEEYLRYGGFPFVNNNSEFLKSFENTLDKILYKDITSVKKIDESIVQKLLKILVFIAESGDEISPTHISADLEISKGQVYELIDALKKTQLVKEINPCGKGRNKMRRNSKYIMPVSVRFAINRINNNDTKIGHLREDFFVTSNVNKNVCFVNSGVTFPDFIVDEYVFEIGGRNKGRKQIKGIKNSFLSLDSLKQNEDTIPLFLFGFL